VLGCSIAEPHTYLHRVGALIEAPSFVPGLSARANLQSLVRLRGLPSARVSEVLNTVGLTGRDTEPVKRFSLGMKQRLGIAAALLPDPELLILDEPTNGLDPAGIVEIRSLLRELGASGRTVLVSSHLMAEIQAACDHLLVIRFGELVYAGPTRELLARGGSRVDLRSEHDRDTPALADALVAAGWPVQQRADHLRVPGAGEDDAAELNRTANRVGITLRSLSTAEDSLEDVFLALTGRDDGQLAAARSAPTGRSTPRWGRKAS
jgi:ABC-2 type transport system ATP-binding protein